METIVMVVVKPNSEYLIRKLFEFDIFERQSETYASEMCTSRNDPSVCIQLLVLVNPSNGGCPKDRNMYCAITRFWTLRLRHY